MAYLPQTLEELQERYNVRYIPVNKNDPNGPFLTFIGTKNQYLQKKEAMWFSDIAVRDIVRRAKQEQLEQIMKGASENYANNDSKPN